jgi:membrane-bound inhibitor of C-type lysozyme
MFKQLHETTTDQKQMATIGREMMDFSEHASMAGLKDKQIAVFNLLSDLGAKLTHSGRWIVWSKRRELLRKRIRDCKSLD